MGLLWLRACAGLASWARAAAPCTQAWGRHGGLEHAQAAGAPGPRRWRHDLQSTRNRARHQHGLPFVQRFDATRLFQV